MEAQRNVTVHVGTQQMQDVGLLGASPNIGLISNYPAVNGHFPNPTENQRRMQVAFIGNDLKERFFPNVDPVGKFIEADGSRYQIIGVSKAKGTVFGESLDKFLIIPIETYFKTYGARKDLNYHALAVDQMHFEQAQDEVRLLLRSYRHVSPKAEDNFGVFTSEAVVDTWKNMTKAIAATAVAIVSVFMVVGGVVITDRMLRMFKRKK